MSLVELLGVLCATNFKAAKEYKQIEGEFSRQLRALLLIREIRIRTLVIQHYPEQAAELTGKPLLEEFK